MPRRLLRVFVLGAAVAFLACSADLGNGSGTPGAAGSGGRGGGGGTTGDAGGGGRGGAGGTTGGTDGGPCDPIWGGPVTSTISGVGFAAWEGQRVQGCFFPSQSVASGPSCPSSVVVDGGFSLTASVCTGRNWGVVVVGSGAQAVDCSGPELLMPTNCGCHDPASPRAATPGFNPGQDCDGGTPDAQ